MNVSTNSIKYFNFGEFNSNFVFLTAYYELCLFCCPHNTHVVFSENNVKLEKLLFVQQRGLIDSLSSEWERDIM